MVIVKKRARTATRFCGAAATMPGGAFDDRRLPLRKARRNPRNDLNRTASWSAAGEVETMEVSRKRAWFKTVPDRLAGPARRRADRSMATADEWRDRRGAPAWAPGIDPGRDPTSVREAARQRLGSQLPCRYRAVRAGSRPPLSTRTDLEGQLWSGFGPRALGVGLWERQGGAAERARCRRLMPRTVTVEPLGLDSGRGHTRERDATPVLGERSVPASFRL